MKSLMRMTTLVVLAALMLIGPSLALAQDSTNPLCNGLSPEDCAILEAAAAASAGVTSFEVPAYSIALSVDTGEEGGQIEFSATGSGAFMLPTDMANPLDGLMLYLQIDDAMFSDGMEMQQGAATVLIKDGMAYINYDGEWYGEEITAEDVEEMGLGDLASLTEMGTEDLGMDLSGVISTMRGEDVDMMGQSMATFTSTVDITTLLTTLLSSPAVGSLLGGADLGMEGMSPEDMQMIGMMLAPLLQGTSISAEQWIGADDSQIHNLVVDVVFNLDMSMFDPESAPLALSVNFSSEVANHNGSFEYEAPAEYRPGSELEMDLGAVAELNLGM